jgi:hypothetical protein
MEQVQGTPHNCVGAKLAARGVNVNVIMNDEYSTWITLADFNGPCEKW